MFLLTHLNAMWHSKQRYALIKAIFASFNKGSFFQTNHIGGSGYTFSLKLFQLIFQSLLNFLAKSTNWFPCHSSYHLWVTCNCSFFHFFISILLMLLEAFIIHLYIKYTTLSNQQDIMYLYCYIAPHSLLEWRTTVSLFVLNAENHFPDLDQKFGLLMDRKHGDAYLCKDKYERWYVSQDNSLPLGRKTKVSGTFQFVKKFQPMRHKTKMVSKMQPPPKAYLENEPNHSFCI